MSQSTRDWLLAKYVKAVTSCADMGRKIAEFRDRNAELTTKVDELEVKVYQLGSELGKYKGYGEVQERLEKMSIGAHVTVNVRNLGQNYPFNIDSIHTTGGHTTINGHV
jgi:hypothetical protein